MKVMCDHAQGCKLEECPHIKKHDSSNGCLPANCLRLVKCISCGDDETMDCSKCKEALLNRVKQKFSNEVGKFQKVTSYKATLLLNDIIQEELKK